MLLLVTETGMVTFLTVGTDMTQPFASEENCRVKWNMIPTAIYELPFHTF